MEKRMEEIIVRTTDTGSVEICQARYDGSDEAGSVFIAPEQTDMVIKWLQEAKAELEQKSN